MNRRRTESLPSQEKIDDAVLVAVEFQNREDQGEERSAYFGEVCHGVAKVLELRAGSLAEVIEDPITGQNVRLEQRIEASILWLRNQGYVDCYPGQALVSLTPQGRLKARSILQSL